MNAKPRLAKAPTTATMRCAIYTRKSTEEGLEQEFNSLDAQRESAEAFVTSQRQEGWTCLPDRYDDGGFTGGNMERPALKRLLADIEAGKLDVVVVYKVDRLSRSLLDFARMMQVFEKQRVSFVSVTQQFNTATSMGRLVLNVLLSFAQFEREIISERTRDKIAATRRKGKWAGGHPLLGFDVNPQGFRLVVNEMEAVRVRAIFKLYLQHESLLPVVQELERRGWRNKRWQTRKGHERGGMAFERTSLYRLLTNIAYVGKVRYKDEVHAGEQPGIVDPLEFANVQAILKRNGQTHRAPVRNRFGSFLKGLLRCAACDCAMTPSHTAGGGTKQYRYYVCSSAQKRGWETCPSKSIPAGQIEDFVVNQIQCIGRDRDLVQEVLDQAKLQEETRFAEFTTERRGLEKDLARWHAEVRKLSLGLRPGLDSGPTLARLADLQERIASVEARIASIEQQVTAMRQPMPTKEETEQALSAFGPVWSALTPAEQARAIHLLIERVDFHGGDGKVAITFHPCGIQALSEHLAKTKGKGQ